MNDKIYLARQDDTLRYRAVAQRTLAQESVCLSVDVALLVSAAQSDQASLQRQIQDALKRFIPNVDWVFSTLHRSANPTVGFEQINVNASARIPSAQNFNLNDRAYRASREGLTLSHVKVDYRLPFSLVTQTVHELRGEIINAVLLELNDYERLTGRKWRIGDIKFGGGRRDDEYGEYTAKGARRSAGHEDLYRLDSDGLSGAEKISLSAEITLRAVPDTLGK